MNTVFLSGEIIGPLTIDKTNSGTPVTGFLLRTLHGRSAELADHWVVLFGEDAVRSSAELGSGRLVFIEGRIRYAVPPRRRLEIVASRWKLLDPTVTAF